MTEEENEAMEEFKREYNDGRILKSDIIIELNTARIVNDLIDKLQKENTELKEDKKELFEEYQKRLKEKFDLEQKISNIIENSYNDIDYFNRDMRKDFEDLLKE